MIKKTFSRKLPNIDADILISPGGYKGIYTMGICHYIKNHFNPQLKSKKILGFSSGTFCTLLMRLNPELEHTFLNLLFSLDTKRLTMPKFLNKVVDTLNTEFKYEDFDLSADESL
jgi:hypothetical protein